MGAIALLSMVCSQCWPLHVLAGASLAELLRASDDFHSPAWLGLYHRQLLSKRAGVREAQKRAHKSPTESAPRSSSLVSVGAVAQHEQGPSTSLRLAGRYHGLAQPGMSSSPGFYVGMCLGILVHWYTLV